MKKIYLLIAVTLVFLTSVPFVLLVAAKFYIFISYHMCKIGIAKPYAELFSAMGVGMVSIGILATCSAVLWLFWERELLKCYTH